MNIDSESTVEHVTFICADNPISKDEHESSMYDLVSQDLLDDQIQQLDDMGRGKLFREYLKLVSDIFGSGNIRKGHLEWMYNHVVNEIPIQNAMDIPSYRRS